MISWRLIKDAYAMPITIVFLCSVMGVHFGPPRTAARSHALERSGELVRGVESSGTTGQLIRVSGDVREALRGVYVPSFWGLIVCLNALKRGFVDELGAHKRQL